MTKNKKEIIIAIMLTIFNIVILGIVSTVNVYADNKCESNLSTPKTIYVGGTGAGNYSTIQGGINVAGEGDTVFVYSGTYYENVIIAKTLTLIGEDRNNTIIDGNGTGDVIHISADWVNVSGFGVRNGTQSIYLSSSNNNQITHCAIYNNSLYGICLYFSSSNQISNCAVYNNTKGIYLYGYYGGCNYNQIANCAVYNNPHGICLGPSSNNNQITNCNVYNNSHGIRLDSSSNNNITNDDVYNNYDGIYLDYYSKNNTITNCSVYNNYDDGIWLAYSSNNNITNCTIYNNYDDGIWIDHSSNNQIINCNVYNNNDDGIRLYHSSNNMLRDNILKNNTYNFCVNSIYGADISYFYQDIDTSNTINDKAVYYIIGQNDILFDGIDVGYLALVSCKNIQVKNLKLTNNRHGLLLINTSHSTIISNYIYNNSWGINLGYSSTNNITANQIYNNSWGIYLCTSPNNNITTNQIYNNSWGIDLKYSSNNNIITSNQIYNNLEGIISSSSSNNNISSNQIYNNKIYGIWLTSSSSNHITANQIYNNFNGIYLWHSSNNNITINLIYNNDDHGVYLVSSSNNHLASNKIYNNDYGLYLDESSNNIMQNNTLENNTYNFGVYGVGLSDFYQDIDISNMINGKPIYYMVEQSHLVFDGIEVGYLGLVSCNNLLVKNLMLANNINGLLLANTSYSTVTSNQIYNNSEEGISLRYSTNNNKITANQIYNNDYGIYLWYSSNNNITINLIYNNSNDGIYLEHSSNNNITSNQIYNNSDDGIFLDLSSNNEIHYNNIYNNTNYGVYSNYYYYTANATSNWWGSADGPSGVAPGSGDAVSSNVLYDPWLTEPWQPMEYIPHVPIAINGNDAFALQASSEGWAGDGTEGNPYIIENYDIDASTACGMYITDTDAYFIIRNCTIHGKSNYNIGVYFGDVTNGKIENTVVYNNSEWGIRLDSSSNNQIANCAVYNNDDYGIHLYSSSNNNITDCNVYNNSNAGIYFDYSSNNTITNASACSNKYYGIVVCFSPNNVIMSCNISDNALGIYLAASDNNKIIDNILSNNGATGIYIQSSNNTVVDNNTITNVTLSNTGIGIHLFSSKSNIITKNTINSTTGHGISLENSSDNVMVGNAVNLADMYGIYLYSSINNQIINSTITNSSSYDLCLDQSSHLTSLNTTFTKTKVYFEDVNSNLTVKWYLHVKVVGYLYANVVDNLNNPLQDAVVRVRDNENGTFDQNYTTNSDGWVRWIECIEYVQNQTTTTYYTPHTVSASKEGFATGYAYPKPNINKSKEIILELLDITEPNISNAQANPSTQEVYEYVNITAVASDNAMVNKVYVNITYPNGTLLGNFSMTGINLDINKNGTYYYNTTYSILSKYTYYIWANDTSSNGNKSALYEFTIRDTAKPEITNIHGRPFAVVNISTGHIVYWGVYISCEVADNFVVGIVKVNITGPVGFTPINVTMVRYSATPYTYEFYQYDATYLIAGTYSYYIWANDTSGNEKKSPEYHFTIPIAVTTTAPAPPPNLFLYIGIAVIAAIIIVILISLMLAGIGITSVRVVKRRRIFYPQKLKCVYCQEPAKITSPDRPLLFQCPKCGGKSVIR